MFRCHLDAIFKFEMIADKLSKTFGCLAYHIDPTPHVVRSVCELSARCC